jgi:hypothetical protein
MLLSETAHGVEEKRKDTEASVRGAKVSAAS